MDMEVDITEAAATIFADDIVDLEERDPLELLAGRVVAQLTALNIKMERIAQALERSTASPVATFPVPQQAAPVQNIPWTLPAQQAMATPANLQPVPQAPNWSCPMHGTPPKWVPGGVSKKSGKAYNGFWACSTAMCDEKVG